MVRAGFHVSIAGSIDLSVDRAAAAGCDCFQIFTRNPRGWAFSPLKETDIKNFITKRKAAGIGPVVSHMPYLPNLAAPNPENYKKSVSTLRSEAQRCDQLGIDYLVTHLGSHLDTGLAEGHKRIILAVKQALSKSKDVVILLENMAGQKNSTGSKFEDLATLINGIDSKRVGICMDTCHAFAAGYDLRDPDKILKEFDKIVGKEHIKLLHANDSKGELGSGLDRHEHLGMGFLSIDTFKKLVHHNFFGKLPFIIETPVDENGDSEKDLRKLKSL